MHVDGRPRTPVYCCMNRAVRMSHTRGQHAQRCRCSHSFVCIPSKKKGNVSEKAKARLLNLSSAENKRGESKVQCLRFKVVMPDFLIC